MMSANYRDREIAFAIAELSCQNADELDEWAEAIASYREEIERNVLTNSAPSSEKALREACQWIAENDPEGMFGRRAGLALLAHEAPKAEA